jgi:hypothetical protein
VIKHLKELQNYKMYSLTLVENTLEAAVTAEAAEAVAVAVAVAVELDVVTIKKDKL